MYKTFFVSFSVLTLFVTAAPVWFEPNSLVITPEVHKQHAILTCHASSEECGRDAACVYQWRKNRDAFKGNSYVDIVDGGKSLLMKAPLTEEKHGGPYTCFVKTNSSEVVIGEVVSVVKFKGI